MSRPCVTLGACQIYIECVVRALCWLSSRQDRLGTDAVLETGASRPHDRPRVLSHLPKNIKGPAAHSLQGRAVEKESQHGWQAECRH